MWQRVDAFVQLNCVGDDDEEMREIIGKYCVMELKDMFKAKTKKDYKMLSDVIANFLNQIDQFESNNREENFNNLERIQSQMDTIKSEIEFTVQELEGS